MKWAIRTKGKAPRTYYRSRTAIGPCFGGTAEEAMSFDTKRDAEAEMGWHFLGFVMAEAVKLPPKKRRAAKKGSR